MPCCRAMRSAERRAASDKEFDQKSNWPSQAVLHRATGEPRGVPTAEKGQAADARTSSSSAAENSSRTAAWRLDWYGAGDMCADPAHKTSRLAQEACMHAKRGESRAFALHIFDARYYACLSLNAFLTNSTFASKCKYR
eukprot:5815543-Pleurochrysis_carterae.AAC.1